MKKIILSIILLLFCITSYAQKRVEFPHAIVLRDINNNKFSSKLFYNFGKPVIIEFWATHCKPCIRQLNSFKEVYNEWQQQYGVKIIVISIDSNNRRKKALKMIKDNEWAFQLYFDTEKRLFNKIRGGNLIPQTVIYDTNFNVIKRIIGIKPNGIYYKLNEDGSIGKKVKLKSNSKYAHLDCDLTQYEDILKVITNNQHNN